jgi:hypothetical protein
VSYTFVCEDCGHEITVEGAARVTNSRLGSIEDTLKELKDR